MVARLLPELAQRLDVPTARAWGVEAPRPYELGHSSVWLLTTRGEASSRSRARVRVLAQLALDSHPPAGMRNRRGRVS